MKLYISIVRGRAREVFKFLCNFDINFLLPIDSKSSSISNGLTEAWRLEGFA